MNSNTSSDIKIKDRILICEKIITKYISADVFKYIIKPYLIGLRVVCVINDVDTLKILLMESQPVSKIHQAMKAACRLGHVDILRCFADAQYYLEFEKLLFIATQFYQVDSIKYLLSQGFGVYPNILREAIKHRDIAMIRYLLPIFVKCKCRGSIYDYVDILHQIAEKNDIDMFDFTTTQYYHIYSEWNNNSLTATLQNYSQQVLAIARTAIKYDSYTFFVNFLTFYKMQGFADELIPDVLHYKRTNMLSFLYTYSEKCIMKSIGYFPTICEECSLDTIQHMLDCYNIPLSGFKLALFKSIKQDRTDVVKILLASAPQSVLTAIKYVCSEYLPIACRQANHCIFDLLLEAGADCRHNNDEALCLAVYAGDGTLMKRLLDMGANIHCRDDVVLLIAVEQRHIEIVKYLLAFENSNYSNLPLCVRMEVLEECIKIAKNNKCKEIKKLVKRQFKNQKKSVE